MDLAVLWILDRESRKGMEENEEKEQSKRFQRMGLEPGDHYLSPDGYLVFTEQYHLKRGYCCENSCRHCPYGNSPSCQSKKAPQDSPTEPS